MVLGRSEVHLAVFSGMLNKFINVRSQFHFMMGLYRQTAGSASVMSSAWREQWNFFSGNDSLSEDNSCFNSSQSTVLNGDKFGGVPLVLLLNFSVFVVWLSVCP